MRANAKSSRSFVRPAIFDLQLEWTVGVGGGGGEKRCFFNIHEKKNDNYARRFPCHNFFYTNWYLKYQAFPKTSWQHGQ